jgi:VWFA-related protein
MKTGPIRLATAVFLASAVAAGQQAKSTFHEEVEVRVMDLDVVVTDRKGRPVPGLKREDFTVRVGGKTVPIDYFARVQEGAIHAPDLADASPDQVLAAHRGFDEAYVPRHFLMYIDLGHLTPEARKRGLEALRDLVTRLGPSDRGRVVVFDRRSRPLTEWTSNKEELFSAISRVEEFVGMTRLQWERQTLHEVDFGAAIGGSHRAQTATSLVEHYAEQQRAEIRQLLTALRSELPTFAPLVGKKAFLFVSGGFEFQPGYVMLTYAQMTKRHELVARRPRPGLRSLNVPDLSRELEEVVRQANASEITFYSIDSRGLQTEGATAAGDESLDERSGISFLALKDSQAGMVELARETGGLMILNANDLRSGIAQLYQDSSVYYSLGVTLSKLGTRGYQNVRVDVSRPGVTVRTRRGYAVRTREEQARDLVQAALKTNLAYSEILITLRTEAATKSGRHSVLPISLTLPASGLTFVPEGPKKRAVAEVDIGVMDDGGRMSEVARSEAVFTLPVSESEAASLVYTTKLRIRRGNHRIVVNVRDKATGRTGTAKADVRVE